MSSETYYRLKKLISGLKESTARDDTAIPNVESNLFRDLEFVYNSDDGEATQETLGVVIERYADLTQRKQFIQFKRLTAVYERDMYSKCLVPIWTATMNADKSVGYVLSPKLTPLREVLKDLKESYQTSEVYYDKLNQVLRLCFVPIALAIDALHTPIYNKRMMYHHRDICIDNIYMRVRKGIDSSGQENVEYDDARLKLTKLTREVLPSKPLTIKYYHRANVMYKGEPYDKKHDWYSFGIYILEVLHLTLPIKIQTSFYHIQDYTDVSHVVSWILSSSEVDAIRALLSQYVDIAVKCLKLEPNEHQPLRYEIPDEMKQRFLECSQTFMMYFEYSVSMWTAQLLWMYEEARPKERPDGSEDEVCQACLLRSTESISTKQHGRGDQPKCVEDCQYHCLICYTNEERLFCSKQHGTTGTIVDHRYSYALILYGQSFEDMCRKDRECAKINSFKEEADTLAKALNSKLICGVPKANIHVRPVYGDGTPEDCLKKHCEVMRELIHGDGNTPCSNDTSYTLFTFYFGHSYHGCDKTVGDWCPSFTHTSDDTFEPLRLKRALVHYHMTSIQKCTNYGTSHPECQAVCLGLNYLVNPCGPSPGSTAHQWSADEDVSISERSQPLVVKTAGPCDVTVWFCQMLQGLYHSQCSGKPHLGNIQRLENYHSKCKVPLGKIDVCFKLARYIYEELAGAFIDGECLRIHQKHLKTHNGYTELMVHIDDEHYKPVLAYYKPHGVFRKVFSANEGEEQVKIDIGGEITCDQIKEVVFNQIKDREQYTGKALNIVLRSCNNVEDTTVSDDNINDILDSSALFYQVIPSNDQYLVDRHKAMEVGNSKSVNTEHPGPSKRRQKRDDDDPVPSEMLRRRDDAVEDTFSSRTRTDDDDPVPPAKQRQRTDVEDEDTFSSRTRTGHDDPVPSVKRRKTNDADEDTFSSRARTDDDDPVPPAKRRQRNDAEDEDTFSSRTRTGHDDPVPSVKRRKTNDADEGTFSSRTRTDDDDPVPPAKQRQRNDADENTLPSNTQTSTVWYRHTGQPEVDEIGLPYSAEYKSIVDEREIIRDIGYHHITHMSIDNGVIPALDIVAPQLTHLQIRGLTNQSDLQILCSLTQLKFLDLNDNNFSDGLPAVLSQLCSLETLRLNNCQLEGLPQRLACETHLVVLDLKGNDFEQLPSAIYNMGNLQRLDLRRNSKLVRITEEISQLSNLVALFCDECESLQFPPYGVCKQGLSAMRKYFVDLEIEKGVGLLEVPVAVVGMLLSGKSSIIKSLQAGERKLTYRKEGSPLDETTRVFQLEDLSLKESRVRFIDYGGHQVYHMTYQLATNDRCLPLVVVNLKQFHDLSVSKGAKEATRKLCIDCLFHLYLACPRLGPPLLALTHIDMLAEEEVKKCRDELLSMSETIRDEMVSGALTNNSSRILHLANRQLPLFHSDDIFEFSNDPDEKSNIERLLNALDNRCKSLSLEIPRLWEKVEKFVLEHKEEAYVHLSEVMKEFPADDFITILRFMHNTGKVLWFEHIEKLSSYIFHDIPAITDMISLLINHSSDELWRERVNTFIPFAYNSRTVGMRRYSSLVQQFTTSGRMDQVLLDHLLESDSRFPVQIAKELLRSFHILHGPLKGGGGSSYILPGFAQTAMDDSWQTEGPVPLRIDIVFGGVSLPEYVYQLMTAVVLNSTGSGPIDARVKRNGVAIYHEACCTHFIHDYSERKVTLQVSSTVSQLHSSWKHLIATTKDIQSLLSSVWKASHAEILVYCAHCLISRTSDPAHDVEPDWFDEIDQDYDLNNIHAADTISSMGKVTCSGSDVRPTVPKPLRFPCNQLSANDIQALEKYISAVEQRYLPKLAGSSKESESSPNDAQLDDYEISDVEDEGYCDISTKENIYIALRPKVVRVERIKQLYRDSEKVYLMSNKVRGRVLVININEYSPTAPSSTGSDIDYDNISEMFRQLSFVIAKSPQELSGLSVKEIYQEIGEETKRGEHKHLGMFVLVIMSSGRRGGMFLDCNGQPVQLDNIKGLLSADNFPAMRGKPKVLIMQACSDVPGESKDLLVEQLSSAAATSDLFNQSATATNEAFALSKPSYRQRLLTPPPDVLNLDDFYIMKASSESYLATGTPSHGSWFIRVLVATFYKHSNHRDIESLFKIIQARVRQLSLNPDNVKLYGKQGGNIPIATSTFTKLRKLYLFPGYHPRDE